MGKLSSTFPTAESVDAALKRANRAEVNVASLYGEVLNKVDNADFNEKTQNLQNQINNIISPVTQDAEVQNARVGADSTSYSTLKNRLDSEYNILSESIKATNEDVDGKIANITEIIGKTISSFTVGTSQHSSRSDMIPWNGKAGDTIYISVSSSPALSPQRNGGVYTYLNDIGTEYGSVLIDGTTPKAVTLLNDVDYIGIWIPALDEECEITVVVESEDSIFKSIDEVSDGLSSCETAIEATVSNMSDLFGKTVSSFVVGTSQHSSRDDMIPWSGKAGDKIYVSVASSPVLSPQRNGGIYTYLDDVGTAYGSILIDNSLPKEITLSSDIDHFGIWIPALAEEHEISVTIEAEDSVSNSLIKLSNDNSINEEKIKEQKNDLIGYNESEDLIWGSDFWNAVHVNQGGYISSDDGISIISDNRYGYTDYIDISEYMLIKLLHNVSESVTHRIYVYDENKTYLSKTEVFSPTTDNPFIFTGYKHAKYMRFSITLSESDTYGLLAVNRIVYGGENIKSINRSMLASAKSLVNGKIISPNIINWDGMLTGTFVNSSNVETYFKEGLETGFVDVSDFNSIKIYLNPDLTRGRAVKFYDSSDNIVRYISLSATSEIAIPENAVKMRMTIFGMTNDGYSDIPYIKFYGIYGSMDAFVNQPYQGKKISILGDSISTFSGWLYPSENVTFYTGNNAGVSAVSDTWWYKLITALGATLEKNNSWSGSAVSNCRGSYPKSGIQRCTNLGNPDVIIVRMGTNDFYFGAELGAYDGTTAIPTGETTFSDAFAKMLDMIMTTYKTAEIWVCTMTQFERIGNVGYPETNSHGETIAEWNERIRKIARALGAKILDDAMCGMTYQNIGVYTDDQPYETTGNGLHPNAAGMSLIANNCIRTMDASTRIRY